MMIGLVTQFIALVHIRGDLSAVFALNIVGYFSLWSKSFPGISEKIELATCLPFVNNLLIIII